MKHRCRIPILFGFLLIRPLAAQQVVTLEVEVEGTAYIMDTTDFTRIARNREITIVDGPGLAPPNFFNAVLIYDVLRVNGKPARGTHTFNGVQLRTSPTPAPGVAIADATRSTLGLGQIELQDEEGRDVGSLSLQGHFGGAAAQGAAPGLGSNFSVVGGTGAFLGARGQVSQTSLVPGPGGRRPASIREDPAIRRSVGNQGGSKYVIQLIPLFTPQVEQIYHSDLSSVTLANPAKPGEILVVRAKGLMPVSGATFGEVAGERLNEIAVPVDVNLNGQTVPVVNKIAWPGTPDSYRVDFRVPSGVTGEADLKLSVGWIPGPVVRIPIQ
jgi:hypothetical protein